MGKKMTKFLDVITFGGVSRRAKKEAEKQAATKNTELKVNTMQIPNVEALVVALGGRTNISNVTSTISTITFILMDASKVNIEQLKKISVKGVVKSNSNITLLIGDCATALKDTILKMK